MRFLLILALFISCLFSQSNITINQKDKFDNFDLLYLQDTTSTLNIKEIHTKKFLLKTSNNFALGYRKGTTWLRFSVENKSLKKNFILSLNESFYEIANLYYYDNDWIKQSNSIFKPIEKREIKTNHLAFDIQLLPNDKKVFYLELKGKYAYFGNLELYEKSYFYFENTIGINTLYVFILGVISIIVLFNLILYLKTKEKIYIFYVGYSFFNIIYLLNISGLLVYVDLQKYIYDLQLAASFMIGFLILFSNEYLEIKKYLPKYHNIIKFLAVPFFIFGFLVVYSYQPWNKFINNFAGLICILLIIISIIIYFKGHNKTKFYIFVMLLYFIFVILFTFMVNGTFEYTPFTRYGFLIASATEVTFFAFLLANRYNDIKENMQYQLESEVEQRTNKLKSLLEERELLLKEVYHRVKNNFHMVIGMLWFESKKENNSSHQFDELINRIKSMSMIHEQLYTSKDLSNINVKEYLNKIINNISSSFNTINLESKIDNIDIEFDHGVSLGIIINEIFTNAIKYNTDVENLCITILLTKKDNTVYLTIQDNGIGFEYNNQEKGLGLKLVEQFCEKLPHHKCTFSSNSGTKFELEYKDNELEC